MFSSKSKSSDNAAPPPSAQSTAMKRGARSSAPSIISADLVVNGTLTSTGDIQIDGRVEGDVHSVGLVIGEKAFIHGEILAEDVTIRGRIQGSVRARKVLLASTCHVEGNILHEAFSVEAGAFFEGNCRHSDNPLAEEGARGQSQEFSKPAPVAQPAPLHNAPASSITPAVSTATKQAPDAPRAAAATFAPLKSGG